MMSLLIIICRDVTRMRTLELCHCCTEDQVKWQVVKVHHSATAQTCVHTCTSKLQHAVHILPMVAGLCGDLKKSVCVGGWEWGYECVGVYMCVHGCSINCIVAACCRWNVMLAAWRTVNAVRLLGNRTEASFVVKLQYTALVI